jgi:hypothetical protein
MGNPPPDVPLESRWKRRWPGWEVLVIHRIWYWPDRGWVVHGYHPDGNKPLVTTTRWLTRHYDRLPDEGRSKSLT